MFASSFGPESLSLCAVGVVAAVLGFLALLLAPARPQGLGWRCPLACAAVLALVGGGLALAGLSDIVWLPALALAGVAGAFALTSSPLLAVLGQRLANLARQPRGQGALLLVGGASVLLWQVVEIERASSAEMAASEAGWPTQVGPTELRPLLNVSAVTDAGQQVPLYTAETAEVGSPTEMSAAQLRERNLERRLIQTGPANNATNCHGWVFTAGRYWVRGAFVPMILQDNGYYQVSAPAVGDIAVFRDHTHQVSHSALVRSVNETGAVLLESKWGRAGRYVHSPEDHIYRDGALTYYRTDRGNHLLRGLPNARATPRKAPVVVPATADQPVPAPARGT